MTSTPPILDWEKELEDKKRMLKSEYDSYQDGMVVQLEECITELRARDAALSEKLQAVIGLLTPQHVVPFVHIRESIDVDVALEKLKEMHKVLEGHENKPPKREVLK